MKLTADPTWNPPAAPRPLNTELVGMTAPPGTIDYGRPERTTFARGINADPGRDSVLFAEGETAVVAPTFGAAASVLQLFGLFPHIEVNLGLIVHGGVKVTKHAPLPPEGTMVLSGAISAVYDKGPGKIAIIILTTEIHIDGTLHETIENSVIVRKGGGFGGDPGPSAAAELPTGNAFFEALIKGDDDQGKKYADGSGDQNPIHQDAEFATAMGLGGIILHGMFVVGAAANLLQRQIAQHDPSKIKGFAFTMTGMSRPGHSLLLNAWERGGGKYEAWVFNKTARDADDEKNKVTLSAGEFTVQV